LDEGDISLALSSLEERDTHLGGEDFDNRKTKYFVQEFHRCGTYQTTRVPLGSHVILSST